MKFIRSAGFRWSPRLVNWGKPGKKTAGTIRGYDPRRNDGKRGRIPHEEIEKRAVDIWEIHALYTLFHGETLIYVGEGVLGDRLRMHWRDDELAGRWDSFSWVSPAGIKTDVLPHEILPWNEEENINLKAKELVEHLESIIICMTEPAGNRQMPWDEKNITWIEQLEPVDYLSPDDQMNEILEMLKKLTKDRTP